MAALTVKLYKQTMCYDENRVSSKLEDSLSMCSSVSEYLEWSALKESIESEFIFPPRCVN